MFMPSSGHDSSPVSPKQRRVLVHTRFFTKTRHPLNRAGHF